MGKMVFVSGADRGVGLALTSVWLSKGHTVFAGQYAKDTQGLTELRQRYGERVHIVQLDVSSDESVAGAVSSVSDRAGQLDLLFNNAAILGDIQAKMTDMLNYTEMMDVFNVNTLGSLRMSRSFMPLLMKSETKMIVNISSEAGSISNCYRDSWYAYCMSKAALNMQSKLIHNGMKPLGGRVLVMHPGWVQTYMQGKLDAGAELTPEQSASSITRVVEEKLAQDPTLAECEYVDYKGAAMSW
ncbi:SDR family NAD(P)-dependent oxidoreductase [Paenibacillus harenae]|uniref:NAD(P)-dependent dehydrogenase (Short-subunit alcohol dehydrogenase family) n=1 Tax=Paenibacillus harenae TaxID=306543 RepID=A0ABT9TXZ4_PAEHA|nr:SDR family NAD(P)-dependent oxidoreductase [Paenibacillus harenae]MDQ0111059.1 NAD(P)-dependent dehydrogenase (short-subunit alcohol dehydrogenase family) [Paenibacillus harenae]